MLNIIEELGESSRRLILGELRSGPKNVSEITNGTGLKQPNVSNHLARMRERKVVRSHRVGRQVYYALAPEVENVVNSIFQVAERKPEKVDLADLAHRYAKAAVAADEAGCSLILDDVYRANTPLIEIYQDLLSPAMTLVGKWYEVDAIDEAQEHFASNITERMLARTAQMSAPTRRHGRSAILGCAAHSFHAIGLRMISDYMRMSGWTILFLGSNTPTLSFINSVRNHTPDMVLVSCAAAESTADTLELLSALKSIRTKKNEFVLGVGGVEVAKNPTPFLQAGADFMAKDLRHFAKEILPSLEAGHEFHELPA